MVMSLLSGNASHVYPKDASAMCCVKASSSLVRIIVTRLRDRAESLTEVYFVVSTHETQVSSIQLKEFTSLS